MTQKKIFSFIHPSSRKQINDDKTHPAKQFSHPLILQKRIAFDLIRIYILLKDEKLIHSFLSLIIFDKNLFYDPSLTQTSPIRLRLFQSLKIHGLTKTSRFRNLILDCYERIAVHSEQYQKKFDHSEIENHVSMRRGMESHALHMNRTIAPDNQDILEPSLSAIPPLPPLDAILPDLKILIESAYHLHNPQELHELTTCNNKVPLPFDLLLKQIQPGSPGVVAKSLLAIKY